jgi:hypothetical protein
VICLLEKSKVIMVSVEIVELVGSGGASLKSIKVHGFIASGRGQELMFGASFMDGTERPPRNSKNT